MKHLYQLHDTKVVLNLRLLSLAARFKENGYDRIDAHEVPEKTFFYYVTTRSFVIVRFELHCTYTIMLCK